MLTEKQINVIEMQLNHCADIYYNSINSKEKERNRGYCQGIGYILSMLGYDIKWDNGKATVTKED